MSENIVEVLEDIDIKGIAQCIFSKPPGDKYSISLRLTPESADQFVNDPDVDANLEIFLNIALLGIKILYGDDNDILSITRAQFYRVQQYMNSMGVGLVVKCNEDFADPWEIMENNGNIKFLRISLNYQI